ncbi:epidermal growth factor receptor kinase substrate 8-like [Lethenteron reissneri]|uniref:epidermal growth factor receptor kinase substrate 8-like n=1 Tax=Lethenteron reissneri TaxID=7753 RepID=UPI002AB7B55A|nr:epidermal growth factor receptor kinase substrate 8-like [Lethenteron reissneri]
MERRTTAKQLYEQRKNYARSSNIKAETAQYHVEHLSTFEMDRKEGLVNLEDGIRRLRLLDSTGKIWTQDMLLQVDERSVSLVDIESKEELENFTLVSIMSCQAVLTEPNYSSILALTCTDVGQARPDLHLFHCVEVGAELIKNDIDSAIADSKDGRKNRRPETLRFNQERMRMSPSPRRERRASTRRATHQLPTAAARPTTRAHWTEIRTASASTRRSDETPEMMAKRVDRDVDAQAESRAYEQMALLVSNFSFSWSRWNATRGAHQLVMQVTLREGEEAAGGDAWGLLLVTAERSCRLRMSESAPAFTDELPDGAELHSTLCHALLAARDSTPAEMRAAATATPALTSTLRQLLASTRVLSYC